MSRAARRAAARTAGSGSGSAGLRIGMLAAAAAAAGALAVSAASCEPAAADTAPLPGAEIGVAQNWADHRGTQVEVAVLDRETGQFWSNGRARVPEESASVAKVLVADSLLRSRELGRVRLSPGDVDEVSRALRLSDDSAAWDLWDRFGGSALTADTIRRYGMGDASPRPAWYDTMVSAADMVHYYDGLLSGRGGLSQPDSAWILAQLRAHAPRGADGYDQEFGLPGALREPVQAVKQGWMQREDGSWVHLSTDAISPTGRWVAAVFTQSPAWDGDAYDVTSITGYAQTMFPQGFVPAAPAVPPESSRTAPPRARTPLPLVRRAADASAAESGRGALASVKRALVRTFRDVEW